MISKFLKMRLLVTWIKYLGAEEKHSIVYGFRGKLYDQKIEGIVVGYWGSCKSKE